WFCAPYRFLVEWILDIDSGAIVDRRAKAQCVITRGVGCDADLAGWSCHCSLLAPRGVCREGYVAAVPGGGLTSSVILLFALFEDGRWAVGAREESRRGGAPSMLRPSDCRPRRDARSHHIVVTRRDL